MATLFVRHDVADFGKWKAEYDAFEADRRDMGVTAHGVYRDDGRPNSVTAYHDFKSMDAAKAFASSSRLKQAMKRAGVSSEPEIWFGNRV
jgi:hypothetical protein